MRRATDEDFLAVLRDAAPGFAASGPVGRTLKSHWCAGRFEGAPAVAKCVTHEDPLWHWYFARELALYRSFTREPPPVRAPRLLFAEPRAALLVLERLEGPALAVRRFTDATLDDAPTAALLARDLRALRRFEAGCEAAPGALPDALRARFRARLLEDPTSPLAWVRDGLALCARDGVLTDAARDRVGELLAGAETTCFAHGDLLLRNVVRHEGALAFVDWECAGRYLAHWDAALAWVGLGPAGRAHFERAFFDEAPVPAVFVACVAFALARELRLQRVIFRTAGSARALSLENDLRAALDRLADVAG